ncbi:MAG: hypothetical protein ACK4N5_08835, partial [Myxococcales bacterium]
YADEPRASDTPRYGTYQGVGYRDFPPCTHFRQPEPPGGGWQGFYFGSGVRAADHAGARNHFSLCMNCAGADTRIIYMDYATHLCQCETWHWYELEYECVECGKFTRYRYSSAT